MPYTFPADLQAMMAGQMATGRHADEDALLCDALHALHDTEAETAAIQAAVDEWQAGDQGVPLDAALAEVRALG